MAGTTPETGKTRLVVPEGDDPLLARLRIPENWKATIFARPPGDGIPLFIKATPRGDLFASVVEPESDSRLGKGKILKWIETDHDGIADEVHDFVPHLDAPRGVEWDGEWLYVVNPPKLVAVRDTDGDHAADENRTLLSGIPPEAENGVTLGIDGWLYLPLDRAARLTGADGTTSALRGPGVVRVRPDGSGLHVFSSGTHGISEVAISPTLEVFGHGRSNPPLGWPGRTFQLTGLDHHGFPFLIGDSEAHAVEPMARHDLRESRSGGTLFLRSRNFSEAFTGVLLTASPDLGQVFRQGLDPTKIPPEEFGRIGIADIPDPTDLDVDGLSRLYLASRGNADSGGGFVVRLLPPDPDDPNLLLPPTGDWRLNATQEGDLSFPVVQHAVLRSRLNHQDLIALEEAAASPSEKYAHRIGALFTMKLGFGSEANAALVRLAESAELLPFCLRALGDFPDQDAGIETAIFSRGLNSDDPRTRREALLAVSRLGLDGLTPEIARLAVSDDSVTAHMAINALAELRQIDTCFEILDDFDNYKWWPGIFQALGQVHDLGVVNGLAGRLEKTDSSLFRVGALKTLARLYHRESAENGDSTETAPFPTGPYLSPEEWEGSQPAETALKKAFKDRRVSKTFLLAEIARNRVPFDDFDLLLSLTAVTPELEKPAVQLILEQEQPPPDSLPFLTFIATSEERPGDLRLMAGISLARSSDDMAVSQAFRLTLEREQIGGIPVLRDELKQRLLDNSTHARRLDWLLEEAHGRDSTAGVLAWAILLRLNAEKARFGFAGRSELQKALNRAESNASTLERFLLAVADVAYQPAEDVVRRASSHPDQTVVRAARSAALALGISAPGSGE